jgi:hypothetical protein
MKGHAVQPLEAFQLWLVIPLQRAGCRSYGVVLLIDIQIAASRRWHAKGFERYALVLAKNLTKMMLPTFSALAGTPSNRSSYGIFSVVFPAETWNIQAHRHR